MNKTLETYRSLDEQTFREAALEILKSADKPLHYFEITDIAIETGYWRRQDEAYIRQHMYQAIRSDIRKHRYGSVFEELAPGTYQVNKLAVNL
ncbi:MAG: hypothetical protein FJX94_07160 [Bacteroidetes bacterium]|nr:hypothetical protein [Bacteroidota bacterium]